MQSWPADSVFRHLCWQADFQVSGELSHDIHCPAGHKVTKVIVRLMMYRKGTAGYRYGKGETFVGIPGSPLLFQIRLSTAELMDLKYRFRRQRQYLLGASEQLC
jgi:hypothetical protein